MNSRLSLTCLGGASIAVRSEHSVARAARPSVQDPGLSIVLGHLLAGRRLLQIFFLVAVLNTALAAEGVVLLHGLARTSRSMTKLERTLISAGYVVLNVDYPSRQQPIADLSEYIFLRLSEDQRLAQCDRVHFVTHSLGGIVLRDMVSRHSLPRLGRVVMLGPPNAGSEVVDRLRNWTLFKFAGGPAGQELGTDAESVPNRLGPVPFELGVIAGRFSLNWINSFLIPGPDDGKVSVKKTKISGMKSHLVLPTTHPTMIWNGKVITATLRFLKTGCFN